MEAQKNISLIKLLEKELIGKKIKILAECHTIEQPYVVSKKKSKNVTDAQFASGNPKYRISVTRKKDLGSHRKYEERGNH